jgi:hypothetical protein
VTHLHLKLADLKTVHENKPVQLDKYEEQRDAYAEQLAKASQSLRYLKVSAGKVLEAYWRVDRNGQDAQPTLTRLSRDEGERIENESLMFSRDETRSNNVA